MPILCLSCAKSGGGSLAELSRLSMVFLYKKKEGSCKTGKQVPETKYQIVLSMTSLLQHDTGQKVKMNTV